MKQINLTSNGFNFNLTVSPVPGKPRVTLPPQVTFAITPSWTDCNDWNDCCVCVSPLPSVFNSLIDRCPVWGSEPSSTDLTWRERPLSLPAAAALAMGLCVAMIAFVRLPSLKVSCLLLSGLLIYDVFWVSVAPLLRGRGRGLMHLYSSQRLPAIEKHFAKASFTLSLTLIVFPRPFWQNKAIFYSFFSWMM